MPHHNEALDHCWIVWQKNNGENKKTPYPGVFCRYSGQLEHMHEAFHIAAHFQDPLIGGRDRFQFRGARGDGAKEPQRDRT